MAEVVTENYMCILIVCIMQFQLCEYVDLLLVYMVNLYVWKIFEQLLLILVFAELNTYLAK